MPTRQQKRARARAPVASRRRGTAVFIASILALLLAGGFAAAFFRSNPPALTRGAITGEHWHANYRVEICGKLLAPLPNIEGEIHSHGDGVMHIHPNTEAFTGDRANMGAFFRLYEIFIGEAEPGTRAIILPDGERFADGDACEGSEDTYDVEVSVNGEAVGGDPSLILPHEQDDIIIRFGPEAAPGAELLVPAGLAPPPPPPPEEAGAEDAGAEEAPAEGGAAPDAGAGAGVETGGTAGAE